MRTFGAKLRMPAGCGGCVAVLALLAAGAGPAPQRPAAPPDPLVAAADSAAASLAGTRAGARMGAWAAAIAGPHPPLSHGQADTLEADALVAIQDFRTRAIELRLVEGRTWRRIPAPIVDPHQDELLLQRVVLGRMRDPDGGEPVRVGLLWFELPGSPAPHVLWSVVLDGPVSRGADAVRELPVRANGWDEDSGLIVRSKAGDIVVETLSPFYGTSTFDADACDACAHLTMVSAWRIGVGSAMLLRADPRDDAAFAVARAFASRHRDATWPAADIDVAPVVDAWLRGHDTVALVSVQPLDGDAAQALLAGGDAPDSLAIDVHRSRGRWTLR